MPKSPSTPASASSSELKRKSASGTPANVSPRTASAAAADDDGFVKVQKRKQRKLERTRPKFQYDTGYFRTGKKIGIAHIRDLSMFITAESPQRPNWILVEHPSAVTHTVVLLAMGLLPGHLGLDAISPVMNLPFATAPEDPAGQARARVPTIPKLFAYGCPTRAPGDQRRLHSVMSTLLMCPLTDAQKKKRDAAARELNEKVVGEGSSTPLLYTLSPNQMLDNGYKLPSYIEAGDERHVPGQLPARDADILAKALENAEISSHGPAAGAASIVAGNGARPVTVNEAGQRTRGNVRGEEGWVETPLASGEPPNGTYPVLAIDCEMVLSEDGQELARVSVVDLDGKVVFDELVTPPKPVTDYLTQFSGLTKEGMGKATHTLESVQEALVNGPNPVITPHTILLGHSLDCDLAALRIRHPLIIDTTVIYRHPRGAPFKPALKWLAQKWLDRKIQNGENGHDSVEDATACVDLLAKKLQHGPDFGDPSVDSETVFERLGRFHQTRTSLVADYGNPRAWFGAKATSVAACTSDDEVVDAVVEGVGKHNYVFARLTELSNVQNWNSLPGGEINHETADEEAVAAALGRFDARLSRLHASLPANTALIVLTGHADPRPMLALSQRRQKFEAALRASNGDSGAMPPDTRWLAGDDRALEAAVADAREGMSFFCVK